MIRDGAVNHARNGQAVMGLEHTPMSRAIKGKGYKPERFGPGHQNRGSARVERPKQFATSATRDDGDRPISETWVQWDRYRILQDSNLQPL